MRKTYIFDLKAPRACKGNKKFVAIEVFFSLVSRYLQAIYIGIILNI